MMHRSPYSYGAHAPYGAAPAFGFGQLRAFRVTAPVGAEPYRAPHGPFFLSCITKKWADCDRAYAKDPYRNNICKKTGTLGCASQVDRLVDAEKAAAAKAARDAAATAAATQKTALDAAQAAAQAAQAQVAELEAELAACLADLAALDVIRAAPPENGEQLPKEPDEGMSTTTMILLGVGGVAVIGGGIYFMTKRR